MDTQILKQSSSELVKSDKKSLWHPFTQMQTAQAPLPICRGEGAYLITEDDTRYLDAISSWWVTLHGHSQPYIADKIREQAITLEHVLLAGCTHPKVVELSERMLALLPEKMTRTFFSDNGSTAVETALKMSIQFWHNQDAKTLKKRILRFSGSYHGDTVGAMSVSDKSNFTAPFEALLFKSTIIPVPVEGSEKIALEALRQELIKGDVAAFIFEPLVQAASGMKMHTASGLDAMVELCAQYNVITIADEVMTGFGRTGRLFACDYLTHQPDIMCFAKGMSGGFLPIGLTTCAEFIYEAFLSDEKSKAFLHGHSYAGNPICCAASIANLDILESEQCEGQRRFIESCHKTFWDKWHKSPLVKECRYLGTILAVEYHTDEESSYYNSLRDELEKVFLAEKILLRPLGNVVYIIPPYCISKEDLDRCYAVIEKTLENRS